MLDVLGVLGVLIAVALWWSAYLLLFREDHRRVRTGFALLLAVHASASLIAVLVFWGHPLGQLLLLVTGALGLIGALALGVTVVVGSVAVSRWESGLLGRLSSGLGGIALLVSPGAVVALAGTGTALGLGTAIAAGTVAGHLGLAYLVFLGATVPYQLFPPHRESTGIVILGSVLFDGRVPPLLRSRLDRAVAERERLLGLGIDPLLVPSGGKGDEHNPAESEAMASYLIEVAGVPADRVHAETESRTTEENLILSHRILDAAGHSGPYIITTSRYHTFRAALLARGLGFADEVIGGPTATSYLPTATLREFVITMAYRLRWVLATVPVTAALAVLLIRLLAPA
ncbi:YdcF family protein [Brachybacterium sp. 107]|uniref:YdcF family protein n=1 Tax=Brachybacterium sp. 107 TaxID=3457736 RepID=UPI004033E75A